jgi:PAS domain S-box-containing protein
MNMLREWFSSSGVMPHGFCYQWKPALVWLHAISDTLIALAYFLIPAALLYFVRKRRDVPFGWMFVCFGTFIAACGATHAMEVWTLWVPSYWLSGGVKVLTALASVPTAVFLVRLMPTALSIPSTEEIRAVNEELKQQAAALKESEARFRQMAENIQEIFWMLNPKTKEATYVSPAFEQICELPLDSIYAHPTSYRELIHPQDQQRVLAGLEKLESTNRFDEEFRIVCPSGRMKWIRSIGFTAKDAAGNVTTLVGTAQEITVRKEMEAVLRESEDRYRDLVEHSTDLICTHDLQGRLLSVNELPCKVLGYSRDELLKKPMRDLLLPEARAQFDESLQTIQKEGFVKGAMVVLTKSGERRIWEYHNTLRTEGVAAPIVRGIAHDITDQRRLEKALRLSEEKFSKAFRCSPTIVSISTLQEGRFLDVNEAFERHSGYARNEIIGHTEQELKLWVDLQEREALTDAVQQQGNVRNQEINPRTKSGQNVVFLLSVELIELDRKECLLTVCQDMTERKRAEEARRDSEEQYRTVVETATDAVISIDEASQINFINPATTRIFGYEAAELVGRPLTMLMPGFLREKHKAGIERYLGTSERHRKWQGVEVVGLRKSGEEFPIEVSFGEVVKGGRHIFTGFIRDITDRKKSEEALRSSEREQRQIAAELERERARLVEAQEVGKIGSWEADLQTLNVIWSEQTHRIFETDPFRFHPTRPKFVEFVHPEDRAKVDDAFAASLDKRSASTVEYRIAMPDGRIKFIEERWQTFRDEEGKPVRVAGTCRDITERVRADEELRQAEERIRAILEFSPNWIFLKDTEGRYLLVNREIERVFGISQEQFKGKTDNELFPPEQAAEYRANDLKVLRAGLTMGFEELALLKDGPHTSIVHKFPLFDTHGNIYATGGVATDITERVRADEELRQARERIESILNSVSDAFILFDRQWRYLYLNDAAIRATGQPLKEILGRTLWELFPVVVGSELDRHFHRAMDERVPVEFDWHFVQPGTDEWWEVRTYPAPEGLAAFATEITERKRAEKELRRLSGQLLRLQDEERRRIARDLHDSTGQDLVALATTLSQLHDAIPTPGRKLRKLANQCQGLADRCIREVRTLSYLLHPPMLDEAGLEAAIRHYVDGFAERTGIEVELEISPRFGRMTPEVEMALFRVIQESLTNIQRHSGSRRAKIQLDRGAKEIKLEISDEGRGASRQELKANGGQPLKAGVGIASMQERVKLICGRLEIKSSSSGTAVRVTIPADE